MRMYQALEIIEHGLGPTGFMVSFEKVNGKFLNSDYFPDLWNGEPLIKTEEEAWELARKFADKTYGKYVNIYVIDHKFSPVSGYKDKIIINR